MTTPVSPESSSETTSPGREESAPGRAGGGGGDPRLRHLLWILATALVVRVICVAGQPIIGADSSRFLAAARCVEQGDCYAAASSDYHPLPAFLFGSANRLQGAVLGPADSLRQDQARRERAAYFVSVLAGLLLVWGLFDITRRALPGVSPEIVGLLAAFHPYLVRSSADIMSDAIFLALMVLALRQAILAVDSGRPLTLVSAGGCVGLAYLARPEALVLVPAVALYWFLSRPREPVRVIAWLILFGVAVALLVAPYVSALYYDEGVLTLTRKKSVLDLFGANAPSAGAAGEAPSVLVAGVFGGIFDLPAVWRVLTRWFFASPEVLAVATLIGFAFTVRKREWRPVHTLLVTVIVCLAVILVLLLHSLGNYKYVTKRHAFALATLCLPFAARGIHGFVTLVHPYLPARFPAATALRTVVVILLLVTGVKAVAPQRYGQVALLQAAEYICQNGGTGQLIYTHREKIGYYCAGQIDAPPSDAGGLLALLPRVERAWIVFYRSKRPDLAALAGREVGGGIVREVKCFEEPHRDPRRELVLLLWERP